MKNLFRLTRRRQKNVHLRKIWMTMKLTLFLFFIGITQMVASEAYSQTTKMTLQLSDATVKEVLNRIEENSEFFFLYNSKLVNVDRKVDVDVKDQKIDEILNSLFRETDVVYTVVDRQIVLTNKADQAGFMQQPQRSISGKVTDQSGGSIPGASIVVKGTTTGVTTDNGGNYSLTLPEKAQSLVFSFVGMKTQEVVIGNKAYLNITLLEEAVGLDEVVTVGYGTMRKSDLTGSIVSVKSNEIKNLPVNSIAEALQGRVAGVMVDKNNGKPGATSEIIIRGVGSINGLSPLFVIDGVARGNNANYNPKDVESIEIIKDASAAAIYGAQAAGGVVLITTKKGSYNEKTQIDFTAYTGVRQITNSYKMLETPDYIRAKQGIGENYASWSNPSLLPNTNWFDELFQAGREQSYLLSMRGGSNKMSYYLSGGYEREDGIQKNNFWERYSLRFNADYKLTDKITFGHQLYMVKISENPATMNVPWRTLPFMAVYNPDGSFASVPVESSSSGGNDVANLAYNHFKNGSLLLDANLFADWSIIKGLNFRVTGAGGFGGGFVDSFTETDILRKAANTASYNKSSSYSESYTLTTLLTYAKLFGKHDFKVMGGYEIKKSFGSSLSASANTFPLSVVESFALSTNPVKSASGSLGYGRGLSQFGRLNYAFDNKYLLTANIRRDGSPKFGPKNRWGVFPSISAGWKVNEESFFKNLNLGFVDLLKPRVSWGILGSDAAIANFAYEPSYQQVTLHSFDEKTSTGGFNSIKVVNEAIKWEEIHTMDIGLDLSMFNNKLTASGEYYSRQTKDMLYNLTIPISTGIGNVNSAPTSMPVNIGSISNKGWEFSVSYRDKVGELSYGLSGNLSHNVNKVINLGLPNAYIYNGSLDFMSGNSPFKTVNGLPVGQIYGLITDGLIQTKAEIDALNDNATAKALAAGTIKPGAKAYYNNINTGAGDWRFKDLNGDGKISDADRTNIGNPWPKFQYGFDLQLAYKGFDFSAQVVGIAGRDVINGVKAFQQNFQQDYQTTSEIFNASYFLNNGLTDRPRLGLWDPAKPTSYIRDPSNNYRFYSTYFVEDGSYLKIKNISLGYTIPKFLLEKINISKLRIYVSGQNLFTFTKFTGLDPEFGNDVKNHGLYGISMYPQTKLFSFGVEASF